MLGRNIIDSSFRVFLAYPKLILPIFFAWIVFLISLIGSLFLIEWDLSKPGDIIYPLFIYYFFFALLISVACSMLLEMIEQIENKENPSFFKSLKITLSENLNDMIPIIFVWSVLWAGITFIESIFSREKRRNPYSRDEAFIYGDNGLQEIDDVTKALEFFNGNFNLSLGAIFFEILKRGLRMMAMMSFCAIAWDNLGYYDAVKKAFRAVHSEFSEFASGFLTTGIVLLFIFLPPFMAFWMWSSGYAEIHIRNVVFLIIYVICALSYAIYMEQLFMAQFYMWYRKWEEIAKKSLEIGREPPAMEDIPVPSILDRFNDLKKNG